ncbi:MAG: hypothetical protein ACJAUD_002585 [Crocinitomicaceae bacterium]|jgi:hypothetical protein
MKEFELARTQASKVSVYSSIISSLIFGGIAIALSVYIENSDWVVVALGMASLGAIFYLRKSREIILTNQKLIINWLYFPRSDEFLLSNLEGYEEEDFKLTTSHSSDTIGPRESTFHEGRRTKLKFKGAKKPVVIDSYHADNYYYLIRKFRHITKNMESDFEGDVEQYAQFEQKTYSKQSHLWFGIILTLITPVIITILYKVILPFFGFT